jgi:hypothetical protein
MLVFYSVRKDRASGGCGSCTPLADAEECVSAHACDCPTDACYRCGLAQEEGQKEEEIEITQRAARLHPHAPAQRPFHLFITVCMHGNEKTGNSPPVPTRN